MLTAERNRTLTEVGPHTPMGELLRRYWHPIGGASEFDSKPVKAVRLLCEDLTLYKDLSGTFGLVDRQCSHRRADLSYGYVETKGLRCNYHGWCFDETGRCIEQPYDDETNRAAAEEKMRDQGLSGAGVGRTVVGLSRSAACAGTPGLGSFHLAERLSRDRDFGSSCNWFQCQENSCDPVHFEWMHDNWTLRLKGSAGPHAARHLQLKSRRVSVWVRLPANPRGASELDANWTTGRVAPWPNGFFLSSHFEWRVPIDDENRR